METKRYHLSLKERIPFLFYLFKFQKKFILYSRTEVVNYVFIFHLYLSRKTDTENGSCYISEGVILSFNQSILTYVKFRN